MRILFLSNLFPPAGNGGYEAWCQEVAQGLLGRGHPVAVLTSRNRRAKIQDPEPDWIYRNLHMEMEFASFVHGVRFFVGRETRELENLACLRQLVSNFQPDILFIWGMWNLTRSLPAEAERLLPDRVVYYMADYWPLLPSQHHHYWQAPAQSWTTRLPKEILKPVAQHILDGEEQPPLEFARVLFPSDFLYREFKRRGVSMQDARVIAGGVNTRPYLQQNGSRQVQRDARRLSLLYAGRLAPEKGIETAIQAMNELVYRRGIKEIHLSIAGSGEQGFRDRLREQVRLANLSSYITFLGSVPKKEMPRLYSQFDAFLFTSTWLEPFGRVLVEAMASGTVVIGTATGGAAEILEDGRNGLVFSPGDAFGLAAQLIRLLEQPGLKVHLVENGLKTAVEKFDLTRMVAEIEAYLEQIAGQPAS